MRSVKFCKFHGFGNDYIVVEKEHLDGIGSPSDFARTICNRHTGVGSDGIAVLERLEEDDDADYFCEIINPDGSIAGFSGNGTRCAVAYLFYRKLWQYPGLRLRTKSGIKNYTLIERIEEGHYWFDSEIGKPAFASDEVPVAVETAESVIDQEIVVAGETLKFSGVNVGNPVACVFVDNFELDWRTLGRQMESHTMFPQKANIVFVKILDKENIELRIWERGAGETSASGTCSSGAAVLCAFTGRTERTVSVHTTGGTTEVHWRDDDEMVITGRADLVFCGEWSSNS